MIQSVGRLQLGEKKCTAGGAEVTLKTIKCHKVLLGFNLRTNGLSSGSWQQLNQHQTRPFTHTIVTQKFLKFEYSSETCRSEHWSISCLCSRQSFHGKISLHCPSSICKWQINIIYTFQNHPCWKARCLLNYGIRQCSVVACGRICQSCEV